MSPLGTAGANYCSDIHNALAKKSIDEHEIIGIEKLKQQGLPSTLACRVAATEWCDSPIPFRVQQNSKAVK